MARNDKTTSTTQAFLSSVQNAYHASMSGMALVRWQRPQHDHVKCNADASFYEQLNITCIVICIVTPILNVPRIFSMCIKTDTEYINHTIQKITSN